MKTMIMMRKQVNLFPRYLCRASMIMNLKRRTKSNKSQLKRPRRINLAQRSPTKLFRETDLIPNLNQELALDHNLHNRDRVPEVRPLLRKA